MRGKKKAKTGSQSDWFGDTFRSHIMMVTQGEPQVHFKLVLIGDGRTRKTILTKYHLSARFKKYVVTWDTNRRPINSVCGI